MKTLRKPWRLRSRNAIIRAIELKDVGVLYPCRMIHVIRSRYFSVRLFETEIVNLESALLSWEHTLKSTLNCISTGGEPGMLI